MPPKLVARVHACGMCLHIFCGHTIFANFSSTCYCKVCVRFRCFFSFCIRLFATNVFMSARCYSPVVIVVQTNASQLHTFAGHAIIWLPQPPPAAHTNTTRHRLIASLQWPLVHLRAPNVLLLRSCSYFVRELLSFISLFSTSAVLHAIRGMNGACCKQITFSNMCHTACARVCALCQIRWELPNREQNFKIPLDMYS